MSTEPLTREQACDKFIADNQFRMVAPITKMQSADSFRAGWSARDAELARLTAARDALAEELARIEAAIDAAGGTKLEANDVFIARLTAENAELRAAVQQLRAACNAAWRKRLTEEVVDGVTWALAHALDRTAKYEEPGE